MEDEISLSNALHQLTGYGPAVWGGVFAAIAVFTVEIILCKRGILFACSEKKIANAKKAGHIITATMTSCRFNDRFPDNKTANRMYIAMYEYAVNGKVKTKQVVSTSMKPPTTISLYYTSNPNKSFSEYDVGKNPLKFLIYIIPVIVAYFMMQTLGFNG